MFLKYLDDLEQTRSQNAALMGEPYTFILDDPYRWSVWAAPKNAEGKIDHNIALTGDDLRDFVDRDLFPYLRKFKQNEDNADTIEYKIGEIFGEIKNKFSSGYNLRDALDEIDGLRFQSQKEKHELSDLYETRIKNMGNAGRNGGEYYTPRPLIRAMIRVVKLQLGEKIYDGACGSAGFLCESYEYLRQKQLTTKQLETLQKHTFYGKERKSLAYVIGIMNLILHGIDTPNIVHTNTLTENVNDTQPKDRVDVILANPPFGGSERKEIKQMFPIKTSETAFLFLQHFIKMLKPGGRAAVVIKNTFLSNADNASRALREELLTSCNLHTILDCPGGTFIGAGVKTVVLFFEKRGLRLPFDKLRATRSDHELNSDHDGSNSDHDANGQFSMLPMATERIWYYQLDPGRSLGKTNPLNDEDLAEFVEFQESFKESERSWLVDVADVDRETLSLSKGSRSPKPSCLERK